MIKKYVKGSSTNPEGVIQALENLGGINEYQRVGNEEKCVYFISRRNVIDIADIGTQMADMIMECFEEIQPVGHTPKIITNLDVAKWYFRMLREGHAVQFTYYNNGPVCNFLFSYELDDEETDIEKVRVDFGKWINIEEAVII